MSKYILQARAEQGDGNRIVLRATAYGVESQSGIVVEQGAFTDSIDAFLRDGYILWQHNTDAPVGYPVSVSDNGDTLIIEAEWHSTPTAQEVRTLVQERLASGKGVDCSIGYYVDDYEQRDDGTLHVLAGRLMEASIVLWGDNPEAEVLKSQSMQQQMQHATDAVQHAVFALHHLARRMQDIRKLREQDGRTYNPDTTELSQQVARLHEALAQVASELEALRKCDAERERQKQQLKEWLHYVQLYTQLQ
jgi:HK97 family phage prohead protease